MNKGHLIILACSWLSLTGPGTLAANEDPELPVFKERSFQLLAEKAEDPIAKRGEVWRFRNPGTVQFETPPGADVLNARFSVLPGIESDLGKNPVVHIGGAAITFALIRDPEVSNLTLLVRGGADQPWLTTDIYYKLDTHEYPESWIEVSLQIDLNRQTCDLYHRDRLWLAGIPLAGEPNVASIAMGSLKQTFLKSFEVTAGGNN